MARRGPPGATAPATLPAATTSTPLRASSSSCRRAPRTSAACSTRASSPTASGPAPACA
jgi:hypothetical protein